MASYLKRRQDIWNEKNGLVSKSYKLNKSIINSFSTACQLEGCSQAGQLTQLMINYSTNVERRFCIMVIREKYASGHNFDSIIESMAERKLSTITDDEISEYMSSHFIATSSKRFSIISDFQEYNRQFNSFSDLTLFLSEEDNEVYNYIKEIMLRQISLYTLVQSGKLMPTQLRTNYKTELDIHHAGGNSLFDVTFNLYPYDVFMIL